ncbi:MAG: hypothetical protein LBF12_07595 [Christensenellaceae bacterium]|nr:hypothetical protein [Christensenellaceae bacterium]
MQKFLQLSADSSFPHVRFTSGAETDVTMRINLLVKLFKKHVNNLTTTAL